MTDEYVYLEDGEDVYDCAKCGNTYITDGSPECPECLNKMEGYEVLIASRRFSIRSAEAKAAIKTLEEFKNDE